jgi:hypothetical protein
MRRREIPDARWEQLDLRNGTIPRAPEHQVRGAEVVSVPMRPGARSLLSPTGPPDTGATLGSKSRRPGVGRHAHERVVRGDTPATSDEALLLDAGSAVSRDLLTGPSQEPPDSPSAPPRIPTSEERVEVQMANKLPRSLTDVDPRGEAIGLEFPVPQSIAGPPRNGSPIGPQIRP